MEIENKAKNLQRLQNRIEILHKAGLFDRSNHPVFNLRDRPRPHLKLNSCFRETIRIKIPFSVDVTKRDLREATPKSRNFSEQRKQRKIAATLSPIKPLHDIHGVPKDLSFSHISRNKPAEK